MSERGSFTSNYIDCGKCLEVVKDFLIHDGNKFLAAIQIPSWEEQGKRLPIVAGKVGALHKNGEIVNMEEAAAEFSPLLCHDLRIAVLCDGGGEKIIHVRAGAAANVLGRR